MIFDTPIFFEKNRVFRVYTGGKLLGDFMNTPEKDGSFPEEWIASSTEAKNGEHGYPKEGVSKVLGEEIYLDELLRKHPYEILGDKSDFGVLVKFLDSAIRLPIQAHPDRAYSEKYFNSSYGKEECWLVLAKRPDACIYFGFREGVTRQAFEKAIEESLTNKDAMEDLLIKHEVESGDVIFVPARTVHAIGRGCLILEVQEPTDFTIQPEYFCGDYRLSHEEMYLGLDKNTALDCFDYAPVGNIKITPEVVYERDNVKKEILIGKNQTEKFALSRYTLTGGSFCPEVSAAIYVVVEGSGTITGESYEKALKVGDYFLLPHAAKGKFTVSGNLKIAECYA